MKYALLFFGLLIVSASGIAQVPQKISYQGLLTASPSGAPVPNGSYDLKFEIYDAPTGGTLRHTETHSGVSVDRGTFSVALGPLPAIFTESLYVEVTVLAGPGIGSPVVFSPRSELSSAPYALAPWTPVGNNVYFSGGNVGIGTSSPLHNMHISSSSEAVLNLQSTGTGGRIWQLYSTGPPNGEGAGHFMVRDGTAGIVRMFVSGADGNVGIGTSAPTAKLDVNGIVNATDFYKNGSPFSGSGPWSTSGADIYYNTGNVGIGTSSPLSQLHIKGASPVRILGDLATITGSEYVDVMARNSTYGTDIGGMRIQRDSVSGDVNTSIFAAANGHPASEKLRINGNGNVGIGTSSPTSKLEIAAQDGLAITGTQPYLTLRDANASNARTIVKDVGGAFYFYPNSFIGGSPAMMLNTGSGYLGLGTTNPLDMLDINYVSTYPSYAAHVLSHPTGGTYAWGLQVQATADFGGGDAYGIDAHASGATNNFAGYFTGDLAYTGSLIHVSDEQFKEHIASYTGGLADVMSLTPRTFTYRQGPAYDRFSFSPGKHYGLVAQEVEKVLPALVATGVQPPERNENGDILHPRLEYKALKMTELIPILVSAIQEQQRQIEELKAKMAKLEQR